MANAAAAGSGGGATTSAPSGGSNPFQVVTNLYAEKNNQGSFSGELTTSSQSFGGAINAGNFLRAVRLIVRSTGGVAGSVGADGVFNVFQNLVMTNVDGSEILFSKSGYATSLLLKYARPFDADPYLAYDYSTTAATPAGTLLLKPAIRWTAGVLANTDTRSQYRFDGTINTLANFSGSTAYTTSPTFTVTPYMDAYAQPDSSDLQGVANQPIPPGVNLQVKQRHQIVNLASSGDNTIVSSLTGNALRCVILVTRDSSNNRLDGLSDPISWRLDNRSLGKFSPDIVFQWAATQYDTLARGARETGVYVFPRFLNPGVMTGQGWLYTSNATTLQWESATQGSAATVEILTDEVYPVGPVASSLVDI